MREIYSFQDWIRAGINIRLRSKEEAYKRMKIANIPYPPAIFILGKDICRKKEIIKEFILNNQPSLVIMEPLFSNLEKRGKFYVKSFDELIEFLYEGPDFRDYKICLIRMVEGVKEGYVGATITNSNHMIIEILKEPWITDVRLLTSAPCSPKKIKTYYLTKSTVIPKDEFLNELKKIRDYVGNEKGYFEFVKGRIGNSIGLYFTDFQEDDIFTSILEDFVDLSPSQIEKMLLRQRCL